MGVVRREGQWRLEKREEGHYEVTFKRNLQATVITPDYSPRMMDDVSFSPQPVHEVDSYAEAEGVFEEHAHGGPPANMTSIGAGTSSQIDSGNVAGLGLGLGSGGGSTSEGRGDGDLLEELENLPPGGIALVFLITGSLVLSTSGFAPSRPVFLFGVGMVGLSVAILAWAAFLFQAQGWREAAEFLVAVNGEEPSSNETGSDNSNTPKTTPPAPEKLKNELIFGRADQECEWCGDSLDNPEVHHIKPRSEGGTNESTNLIVLCPTCHRKADQGGISRTKLRGKLRHILSELH